MTQPDTPRVQANRLNSLKSTGPRSLEGKRIARRNSLKHGFGARTLTRLSPSDRRRFDQLQQLLRVRFMPEGDIEEKIFNQLSVAMWNQDRLHRLARYKSIIENRVSTLFVYLQALRAERLSAAEQAQNAEQAHNADSDAPVTTNVPA